MSDRTAQATGQSTGPSAGQTTGHAAGEITGKMTPEMTVHMAASVLLGYPDERLVEALPLLARTVAGLRAPGQGGGRSGGSRFSRLRGSGPGGSSVEGSSAGGNRRGVGEAAARLAAFIDQAAATPLPELAAHYVAIFDLKRRCCPYLTYYTYGDTRKRGMALLRFKHAYREAGFEVTDELPDHLAVVCELSGRGAGEAAGRLLREHRAGVETLLNALRSEASPYADVVAAVLATLPEPTARERAAALRLAAEGPPSEEVGLEPFSLDAALDTAGLSPGPGPGMGFGTEPFTMRGGPAAKEMR